MSRLLVRPAPPGGDGQVLSVTRESAGWGHVGFGAHRLAPGQSVAQATANQKVGGS
jgi:5-deoxy-glucuronate isomerase